MRNSIIRLNKSLVSQGVPRWMILIPAGYSSRGRVVRTAGSRPAAVDPGMRVVELHILGLQLRSIKIGRRRRWSCSRFCWSPANALHWWPKRTSTVEPDEGLVNRCGRRVLIKQAPAPAAVVRAAAAAEGEVAFRSGSLDGRW